MWTGLIGRVWKEPKKEEKFDASRHCRVWVWASSTYRSNPRCGEGISFFAISPTLINLVLTYIFHLAIASPNTLRTVKKPPWPTSLWRDCYEITAEDVLSAVFGFGRLQILRVVVKGGYPLLFSGFVCSGSRLPWGWELWVEDLILMELNFLVWGPSGGGGLFG